MIKSDQPAICDKNLILTAVSSKKDGNLSYLKSNSQIINIYRNKWLNRFQIKPEDIVCMNPRSTDSWDTIKSVSLSDRGAGAFDFQSGIAADALMTNKKGLPLMLLVADCNPVIVHDPKKGIIALVHLGWRSTIAKLADKVIEAISDKYLSDPADIKVYIGPSIRSPLYSFPPPLEQQLQPDWRPYLTELDNGEIGINLVGYNCYRFMKSGIRSENIQICPTNTADSIDYFSNYRATRQGRGDQEGRFAVLAMLK